MEAILINNTHTEKTMDKTTDKKTFSHRSPQADFFISFVCIPILVLAAVFTLTTLIMVPISLMMGWL